MNEKLQYALAYGFYIIGLVFATIAMVAIFS